MYIGPNCEGYCDGVDCISECIGLGCIYDKDSGSSLLEKQVTLTKYAQLYTNVLGSTTAVPLPTYRPKLSLPTCA